MTDATNLVQSYADLGGIPGDIANALGEATGAYTQPVEVDLLVLKAGKIIADFLEGKLGIPVGDKSFHAQALLASAKRVMTALDLVSSCPDDTTEQKQAVGILRRVIKDENLPLGLVSDEEAREFEKVLDAAPETTLTLEDILGKF